MFMKIHDFFNIMVHHIGFVIFSFENQFAIDGKKKFEGFQEFLELLLQNFDILTFFLEYLEFLWYKAIRKKIVLKDFSTFSQNILQSYNTTITTMSFLIRNV